MSIIKYQDIEDRIIEIRGEKVILDSDVATIYGVETKRVNEAVKNNQDKFPDHYMFELNNEEFDFLRSKFSTTKLSKTRVLPKSVYRKRAIYVGNNPEK